MIRTMLVGVALLAGTLAFSTPAMAASGYDTFAGVYPNDEAVVQACRDGVADERWVDMTDCYFKHRTDGQWELWVRI
ncbi:hypothetical protein GCM10011581_45430 [Saccharopolyspora subtropica]|uniref:Uncharacterized protein n=1 Tax=Saccharopolyspora thermophila TaxID=89367 RepID=A0A917K957_9PSEU|nr:hypothetical protein [Saccharopolyspora subtropica]GGJ03259.1 hypothetical protein GCM10011581_45430 [Saccharopolyspora subtropica]